MAERRAIGVDLGGTKLEAVVVEPVGGRLEVLVRRRVPTGAERGYDAIVETTAALIERVEREAGLPAGGAKVGVGMPGGIARRTGLVKNSNTVCLNGRPFRDDLAKRASRAIAFDNDANCFALAETHLGAAAAHRDGVVVGVILGTGVGGGVVVFGNLWSGAQGIAGEWGHHAVFHDRGPACYCGRRGCLETFASGPAVENDYFARTGRALSLARIAAARGADADAAASIELFLEAFGRGLANVIDLLDPSAIVLGGGVSNLDLLYDEGRARVAKYVFNDELTTPILRHALGDSAGVLGAAMLALSPCPGGTEPPPSVCLGPSPSA